MREKSKAVIFNPTLGIMFGYDKERYMKILKENIEKLIEIWERHIPSERRIRLADENRNKIVLSIFIRYFAADFKRWEKFVISIAESTLLTHPSKKFRFSMNWAIQEKNVVNILRGKYHTKEQCKFVYSVNSLQNDKVVSLKWKKFLLVIANQMGRDAFLGFRQKVKFAGEKDGILMLKTSSGFKKLYEDSCYYKRRFFELASKHFKGLKKIQMVSNEAENISTT